MSVSNPFLPLAQDEGSNQGRFHTLNVTGSGATVSVSAGVATINASGGGGSSLGLWDFWYEYRLGDSSLVTSSGDVFQNFPISTGTINSAIQSTDLNGYNNFGLLIRSSATANSGYRFTTNTGSDIFGVISHKFICGYRPRTAFTNNAVRLGFHNATSSTAPTSGAYFEIDGSGVASGKTATNNANRTTTASTYSLSVGTNYVFDVDVNAAGSEARFRIYAGTSTTAVFDQTVTGTIPTVASQAFNAGWIGTNSSGAADIGILYFLGLGTTEGFNRARGAL